MTATLADLTDPNAPTPYKAPANPLAYTPGAATNTYTPNAPTNAYTPAAPTSTYTPGPNTYVPPGAGGLAGGQGGANAQPVSAPSTPPPIPLAQPTSTPDPLAFAPPATPDPVNPSTPQLSPIPLAPDASSSSLSPTTPPAVTPQGNTPTPPATAPAASSAPIISGATEAARTSETGGVTEYGKVWVPGSEPPAGLDSNAYAEWQQNNPQDVGWSQGGWDYLHQAAAIDTSTDSGMEQANALFAQQAGNPGPIPTQDQANYAPGGSAAGGQSSAPGVQPIIPPGTAPTQPPVAVPDPITAPMPIVGGGTNAPAPTDTGGSIPTNTPSLPGTDANGLPIPTTASNTTTGAGATATSAHDYSLTPTTAADSLANSTITPGAGVDRFKIAQDEYNASVAASEPQYEADLTLADRMAAGAGAIGSGQLNTSLGNIVNTRQNTLATQQSGFLNDALTGSIADAYQNIGIAQQQQGVQIGQQNTAFTQATTVQQLMDSEQGQQWTEQMQALGFNAEQIQQAFQNELSTQQLSDAENAQQFYQAYEQYVAGTAGNPVSYEAWLAAQYGKAA